MKVEWNNASLVSKVNRSTFGSEPDHQKLLVVQDVVVDDTGNITCMAENSVGRVFQDIRLIVDGRNSSIGICFPHLCSYIVLSSSSKDCQV